MPNDLPPWEIVYQQAQRWIRSGCFEALAEVLRALLRLAVCRAEKPSAAILGSRTLRFCGCSRPHSVEGLARDVQAATGDSVELAFVDQGDTGETTAAVVSNTASRSPWSNCPRPSAASFCCAGAG